MIYGLSVLNVINPINKPLLTILHLPHPVWGFHFRIDTFNTLRPRQNRRHFANDIFKGIFLNENVWISIKISLKFVPKGPINNIPAWVQIMVWRRSGDKPLSEAMMVNLPTHICVSRPQWVKHRFYTTCFSTHKSQYKSKAHIIMHFAMDLLI